MWRTYSLTSHLTRYQAKALWIHYDDSVSHDFVQERQLMHVQIYSLSSFCGRVLSGKSITLQTH